jgi:phosphoribosylaminoimidazole-succinocarboxamide synthase
MSNTITLLILIFQTKSVYRGKVREVYNINDELLVMVYRQAFGF